MKYIVLPNRIINILILVTITGGYLTFFFLSSVPTTHDLCLFKSVTGIPCPGCGMGRGTLELFHGNLKSAVLLHPLAIPFNIAVVTTILLIGRDIKNNRTQSLDFFKKTPPTYFTICIILVLLAVWGWNIYRGI